MVYLTLECPECGSKEIYIDEPEIKPKWKPTLKEPEEIDKTMQSIKEIIIGNSIWRKHPDGHTDFNEIDLDKLLSLIEPIIQSLLSQKDKEVRDVIEEFSKKEFYDRLLYEEGWLDSLTELKNRLWKNY